MCRFMACSLLLLALPLTGCVVVQATGAVVGAAGTLVSVTAKTTAGAINTVAGGGGHKKKSDCTEKDADEAACAEPASH
jgi:predicted amino acid dehydrogenase